MSNIRRHLVLTLNDSNHILTRVDVTGLSGAAELQLRCDLAKEFDLRCGEARFDLMEGPAGKMVRINELQVPDF